MAQARRTLGSEYIPKNNTKVGSSDMTNQTIRDPKIDHLLTSENSALVLIDYQPSLIGGQSHSRGEP